MNIRKSAFVALLAVLLASPAWSQSTNPEDEILEDEDVPAVPVSNENATAPANTPESTPEQSQESHSPNSATEAIPEILSTSPSPANTPSPSSTVEMVTIPRAVWEQLQRDVAELKTARATATPAPVETAADDATSTGTTPSRNYLALPDISLILQAKGQLSNDRRDDDRNKLSLSEGELSIQGYVYPNVKAEAYLVAAPGEDEAAQFEEGFLTFQGVRKGLNINVGRKFTPFGRTGELHNHSWLYARQLLPIRNLVSEEALVGDGVNFNYLFPTKGKLFVRGSFGIFSGEGTETAVNLADPHDPFFGGVPGGTGAGFTDRFYNARLWAGHPVGANGEVEVGVSHARGNSEIADGAENSYKGRVNLTGADLSYRHFMNDGKRLLLRTEYFKYTPRDLPTSSASGYYALANMKLDPRRDVGLLYEKSGFPNASGESENALSLIYTTQLTEQFYMRLMGTHGDRPGGSYNELRLQFTAGMGPHTHALE